MIEAIFWIFLISLTVKYSLFSVSLMCIVPLLIIVGCYVVIFVKVWHPN